MVSVVNSGTGHSRNISCVDKRPPHPNTSTQTLVSSSIKWSDSAYFLKIKIANICTTFGSIPGRIMPSFPKFQPLLSALISCKRIICPLPGEVSSLFCYDNTFAIILPAVSNYPRRFWMPLFQTVSNTCYCSSSKVRV